MKESVSERLTELAVSLSLAGFRKGISTRVFQYLLGHDRLTTTELYLNLSPEDVIKEFSNRQLKKINIYLNRARNLKELKVIWHELNVKLEGHSRHYGLSGNMVAINRFYFLRQFT